MVRSRLTGAAACAALLAACQSAELPQAGASIDPGVGADQRLAIVIEDGVSETERDAMRAFVAAYADTGEGSLLVAVDEAAPNGASAALAVRHAAQEEGVGWAEVSVEPGGASGVAVLRYRHVEARRCSVVGNKLDNGRASYSYPDWGCTQTSNLAAMVADKAHLDGPPELQSGDLGRRQVVIEQFRQEGAKDPGDASVSN